MTSFYRIKRNENTYSCDLTFKHVRNQRDQEIQDLTLQVTPCQVKNETCRQLLTWTNIKDIEKAKVLELLQRNLTNTCLIYDTWKVDFSEGRNKWAEWESSSGLCRGQHRFGPSYIIHHYLSSLFSAGCLSSNAGRLIQDRPVWGKSVSSLVPIFLSVSASNQSFSLSL